MPDLLTFQYHKQGPVVTAYSDNLRGKQVMPGQSEYPKYLWAESHVPQGARVLDIGCNSGQVLRQLRTRKGAHGAGVDIDPSHIEWAKNNNASGILFYHLAGEFVDREFGRNWFDVVLMLDVIEHVPSLRPFLRAARHVLKPGGKLVVTVPYAQGFAGYPYLFGRDVQGARTNPQHRRVFTWERLETTMRTMGFETIEHTEIEKEPYGVFYTCGAFEKEAARAYVP